MEFKYPDKRVQICWSAYTVCAAILPTAASSLLFQVSIIPHLITRLFTAAWCGALLFLLVVYYPLRRRRLQYCISEEGVTVKSGVCFITRRYMPLSAVRYVTALRGPFERMFGLTSLLICAAGGRLLLEGIPTVEAEALTRRLL